MPHFNGCSMPQINFRAQAQGLENRRTLFTMPNQLHQQLMSHATARPRRPRRRPIFSRCKSGEALRTEAPPDNSSAAKGYDDFHSSEGHGGRLLDPACELEVLKCIMLRESYLARLTRVVEDMAHRGKTSQSQMCTLPSGMVDLLDLLRTASLDTVEGIILWRLSKVCPTHAPFEWNGQNYLMKMLHDCDFLDGVEVLRSWLGFEVLRNPFFMPIVNLFGVSDSRSLLQREEAGDLLGKLQFDKADLTDIGRQPWLGPLELKVSQVSRNGSGRRRGDNRKRQKASGTHRLGPYVVAVVNDPALVTKTVVPIRKGHEARPCITASIDEAHTTTANLEGLVPNNVSREDTRRVEAARKTLNSEEWRTSVDRVKRKTSDYQTTRIALQASSLQESAQDVVTLTADSTKEDSLTRLSVTQAVLQAGPIAGYYRGTTNIRRTDSGRLFGKVNEDVLPLTRTAADLVQRLPPEPHPGLGLVVLRSDLPGGELHPRPFVYTLAPSSTNDVGACSLSLEGDIATSATHTSGRTMTARPTTTSMVAHSARDGGGIDQAHQLHLPLSLNHRPVSAPHVASATPASCTPSSPEKNEVTQQKVLLQGSAEIDAQYRTSDTVREASRKVGAELRALTAAGTAGRRQPPPREVRLPRLARDVARHSAELRQLAKNEQRLRRSLAYLGRRRRKWNYALVRGQEIALGEEPLARESGWALRVDEKIETDRGEECPLSRQGSDGRGSGCRRRRDTEETRSGSNAVQPSDVAYRRVKALLSVTERDIVLKTSDLGGKRDELDCLRMVQKQERERKDALNMERRRLRLEEGQSLPEDEAVAKTLEDSSSVIVQKRVRGMAGRKYVTWYKRTIITSATTIQRGMRYIWDRRATARRLRLHASARPIQAAFRMSVARRQYLCLLRQRRDWFACRKIQKACRGMRGRRRAASRGKMIAAATRALDWVSLENLHPKHLKELAQAIHGALVDPLRQFPPAGVLGAMRVVLSILEDTDGVKLKKRGMDIEGESDDGAEQEMVTFQTALGRTVQSTVSAHDLTWEMAARVLGRPFRLLRRLRAFASGLGAPSDSSPPRLLRISTRAAALLSAYREDPSWTQAATLAIAEGATAATALVGWATELERVHMEQPRVQEFLRDAQPAWLRRNRCFQKGRRRLEILTESCRYAVLIAEEHYLQLQDAGRAYGDPLLASETLRKRREAAEVAVRDVEGRQKAFLETQAEAEATAGRIIKERAEFAEREASIAARALGMAHRIGQGGPGELEDLVRRKLDWEVVLRELQRRLRVWERRCRDEITPLLEEWVPPTERHMNMARSLGAAKAWKEITVVQHARLLEEAGGRRYVKGLNSVKLEGWKRLSETLQACQEDIASGEARLYADIGVFEEGVAIDNEEKAARKVSSASWDNATEETATMEREEDAQGAVDERRIAMGTSLPRGLLENASGTSSDICEASVLVLLGLDLPASVRQGIRDSLHRDAPRFFGVDLVGTDALPRKAAALQARVGRAFLALSKEHLQDSASSKQTKMTRKARPSEDDALCSDHGRILQREESECRRANIVQTALQAGRSVILDVAAGPGLWARGRFLRDLESLLDGLDVYNCHEVKNSSSTQRRNRPTVLLVDGHEKNRSGGGAEIAYGTECARKMRTTLSAIDRTKASKLGSRGPLNTRVEQGPSHLDRMMPSRLKALLEEAAQCLHDLSTVHAATPVPFLALSTTCTARVPNDGETRTSSERYVDDHKIELAVPVFTSSGNGVQEEGKQPGTCGLGRVHSSGLETLLASCFMILHPWRDYNLGEYPDHGRPATAFSTQAKEMVPPGVSITGGNTDCVNATVSQLASATRRQLDDMRTTRGVADLLGKADLTAIPLKTTIAIRRLVRCSSWPNESPRPIFSGCPASEAFTGWIMAAATASTELAFAGGGKALHTTGLGEVKNPPESKSPLASLKSGNDTYTSCTPQDVDFERRREMELLEGLEESLVDEEIVVCDDDSPSLLCVKAGEREKGHDTHRQYCAASNVFTAMMEIVLRPLQVFEDTECAIALAESERQREVPASIASAQEPVENIDVSPKSEAFHVSVSRAFGFIYVRAAALGTGRTTTGQTILVRTQDDNLIPLLSANWMEKHDLSALRELRTEPAVWHALVNTLVLHYPDKPLHREAAGKRPHSVEILRTKDLRAEHPPIIRNDDVEPMADSTSRRPGERSGSATNSETRWCSTGVLSFRHARRLTLKTTCFCMRRAVPVNIFEESQSDFWCEAYIPADLICAVQYGGCAGIRIPKECISLLLDENHPMRMQTMLDISDLRELSVLIADRLKLCRTGPVRRGPRPYGYWLDDAIRIGNEEAESYMSQERGGSSGVHVGGGQGEGEFRLSLRKRSIGQVIFSRLVSFWVPVNRSAVFPRDCEENYHCHAHGTFNVVQRLVTVKEIAHRGECGELRVDVHDLDRGCRTSSRRVTPDLTTLLLHGSRAGELAGGRNRDQFNQYWLDVLTWRFSLVSFVNANTEDIAHEGHGMRESSRLADTCSYGVCQDECAPCVRIDDRAPLVSVRALSVRSDSDRMDSGQGLRKTKPQGSSTLFDLLLLPPHATSDTLEHRKSNPLLDLVAIHRGTKTAFSLCIPVDSFLAELHGALIASYTIPAALSGELELPISADLIGRHLRYVTRDASAGHGGSLFLRFPGAKELQAGPYVGLRGVVNNAGASRMLDGSASNRLVQSNMDQTRRSSRASALQKSSPNESQFVSKYPIPAGAKRALAPSSTTDKSAGVVIRRGETRNERMIFRRKLQVHRLSSRQSHRKRERCVEHDGTSKHLGPGETSSDLLIVSVYETFTAATDGKVQRFLKFSARDEGVRPAIEATAVVPWVGTSEGVEGSALWRVITQGLSFRRMLDEAGKYVGIDLAVSVQAALEEFGVRADAVDGASETKQASCRDSMSVRCTDKEQVPADFNFEGAERSNPVNSAHQSEDQIFGSTRPAALPVENEITHRTVGGLGGEYGDDRSAVRSSSADSNTAGSFVVHADIIGTRTRAEIPTQEVKPVESRQGKVYDGWHCITGIRLHVQCFQQGSPHAASGVCRALENREALERRVSGLPAARGGVISFPPASFLRFVLCDPRTGRTIGAQVSVDDIRANLSTLGGIVEAELLNAGRRPALAQALACNLRLVFEADGGYRVVLPLPIGWNCNV